MNTGLLTGTFDCTTLTEATNITSTVTLPSNTGIFGIVQIDGTWKKLSTNTAVATQTPTTASIIAEGDTWAALTAAAATALVGKNATIKIAFESEDAATVMPTMTLPVVNGKTGVDTFAYVEESPEQILSTTGDVTILNIAANSTTSNGGSVVVLAKLKQSGTWNTSWKTLADCANQSASSVKYQPTYTAETIGVSSAKLDSVVCNYQG